MSETPDYAIEIHAKALIARYKKHAVKEAEKHAKTLHKNKDKKGYEVWMRVADKIIQIKSKKSTK